MVPPDVQATALTVDQTGLSQRGAQGERRRRPRRRSAPTARRPRDRCDRGEPPAIGLDLVWRALAGAALVAGVPAAGSRRCAFVESSFLRSGGQPPILVFSIAWHNAWCTIEPGVNVPAETAKQLGVAPLMLARWERVKREPQDNYMAKVDRLFGDVQSKTEASWTISPDQRPTVPQLCGV